MHLRNFGWRIGLGWIYMIIFWVLIIAAVVYLFKFMGSKWGSEACQESPLWILKRRYARGDITKEEFE